ncbi:MAG: ATP-binding protein [Solirubrobacterales bacterium]|nr:ATP-binding protein [Solirubrobacterales bacterium]MBV9801036.1 ATP-binding protein [Solirubrobacterales bacterium]
MTVDSPTVRLELDSTPEALSLVRSALGGVAEQLALDPELLDDLKTAVSEACNNVVMHAYKDETGPLEISLYTGADRIEVVVRDRGAGMPREATVDDRLQGVGLPIIRALTQRASFRPIPGGGTEVEMIFVGAREGKPLFHAPTTPSPDDGWTRRLDGDAVVSLSPISIVGGVLGRLARALAARARFSLDRFSDVYLVTDALAAHTARSASGTRIGFGIATGPKRLELSIGPFRAGTGAALRDKQGPVGDVASALLVLSDELDVRPSGGGEMLHIVMIDSRSAGGGSS